jgi:hypothetical protein
MGKKKGEMSDMNGEVGGERRESLDVLYYLAVGPVVLWQQKGYEQDVVASWPILARQLKKCAEASDLLKAVFQCEVLGNSNL